MIDWEMCRYHLPLGVIKGKQKARRSSITRAGFAVLIKVTYVRSCFIVNDDMFSARRTVRFEMCDFFFTLRKRECTYTWSHISLGIVCGTQRVKSADVYMPAAFNDTPKESRGLNDLRVWISVIWSVFASDGASVGVRVLVHTTHTHTYCGCTLSHTYIRKRTI